MLKKNLVSFEPTTFSQKLTLYLPKSCGEPQGSILGALLFLICVNDFPKCFSTGKPLMFADDTNVFFSKNLLKNCLQLPINN